MFYGIGKSNKLNKQKHHINSLEGNMEYFLTEMERDRLINGVSLKKIQKTIGLYHT